MSGSRIRVWLEPGYDGGRFGAWMLDWPGCFVWRPDRTAALAAQGETWTLAKVLRRLVYHAIGHLAELEARIKGPTRDPL